MRSNWSKMYHAHILFEKVVAETKASHIVLSYNNDGFMSKDYIEKTLKRLGIEETYDCVTIDYKKYNNTKCQGADGHQEYLFYIQKKPANEVIVQSPLNYTGSKTKMVPIIKEYLPQEPLPEQGASMATLARRASSSRLSPGLHSMITGLPPSIWKVTFIVEIPFEGLLNQKLAFGICR